jgi:hypothetical protein
MASGAQLVARSRVTMSRRRQLKQDGSSQQK